LTTTILLPLTGIKFRGIPTGHEFTSLLLAILNADGKGKNIPDEAICRRIQALKGDIHLTTYVSLTCTNCPDVVQTLNLMALLNPRIHHEMVDGAIYREEANALGVQAVPSVPYTTGEQLADTLKTHLQHCSVDLLEHRKVEKLEIAGKEKIISISGGGKLIAPIVIIATGVSWRRLNVPGESDYIGRGVAFCPHCDGPFYQGKHVAVVGGGNSGIEAAIDLAGICSKVTVFEFLDTLKADSVLPYQSTGYLCSGRRKCDALQTDYHFDGRKGEGSLERF
jgi:alkyl hydroperoxide reductase subunit AhpF